MGNLWYNVACLEKLGTLCFPFGVYIQSNSGNIHLFWFRNMVVLELRMCIRSFSVWEHVWECPVQFSWIPELDPRWILAKTKSNISLKSGSDSTFSPAYQPFTEELIRVFDRFNSNRDGKISPGEYKSTTKALGMVMRQRKCPKELRRLIWMVMDLSILSSLCRRTREKVEWEWCAYKAHFIYLI